MGKSNLFQIACADVRERFHYVVWLFIIVCRNMSASGWQYGKAFSTYLVLRMHTVKLPMQVTVVASALVNISVNEFHGNPLMMQKSQNK